MNIHRTDTQCEVPDEIVWGTRRPYGYAVYPCREFALISELRGVLGWFDSLEDALPWMRILVRGAIRGQARLDFRLHRWDSKAGHWELACRELDLDAMHQEQAA